MLQIRNVPDDLHRLMKSRAAMAGLSVSDYALNALRHGLERPTREELIAGLQARTAPVVLHSTPTELIRDERAHVSVVDASAIVEVLLSTPVGNPLRAMTLASIYL